MTTKQAAKILKDFNKWRRGAKPYDRLPYDLGHTPTEIGLAIDVAVKQLTKTK